MKLATIKNIIFLFIKSPRKFKMIMKGMRTLFVEGPIELKRRIKSKLEFSSQHESMAIYEGNAQQFFYDQQNQLSPNNMKEAIDKFSLKPLISILMPTYNTPANWLKRAIESVIAQTYTNWELCIVDNGSSKIEVCDILEHYSKYDTKRIKVTFLSTNSGISVASNCALRMAMGSYVALLDHDDELTPDALFWVAKEINAYPNVDFIYSDECKIDNTEEKRLFHFFFKPDWSPEVLLNCMYTGHLTVYRTEMVKKVGGFRPEYDFSQDYDLALRISEQAELIRHIERVLYLWRAIPGSAAQDGKPWARISNLDALRDTMRRRDIDSFVFPYPYVNRVKIRRQINEKVSIVVPSDSGVNLENLINALLTRTAYGDFEIVVVTNSVLIEKLKKLWRPYRNIVYAVYDKPFNFSDKCNVGVEYASGDILVFLNDDVIPREKSWIEDLIEYLYLPGIGAVSPKLVYEDGKIQYAGMVVGVPGFVGTAFGGYYENEVDEFNTLHRWVRNVSVLSGACFAIRRTLFLNLEGFDSVNTPNGHSDIDLSFRIRERGFRIVYTPHTVLVHKGNHSWHDADKNNRSDIYLMQRWADYLCDDPYFTSSMKKFLYRDFSFQFNFYGKRVSSGKKRNVLLISHEMSATGAPRVLLYMARIIRKSGAYPVIVAPEEGELLSAFRADGFHVIIYQNLYFNDWMFKKFAENFDLIIANTLVSEPVVRQLAGPRIVWWLHEGEYALRRAIKAKPDLHKNISEIEEKKTQIFFVSEYSREIFRKAMGLIGTGILPFGIPDVSYAKPKKNDLVVVFTMAGSIENRKGQDVFVAAIAMLPRGKRGKARFNIIGGALEPDFYAELLSRVANIPEIFVVDALPHEEIIKEFENSDVVVCPSRDEPFSITMCEAMMLSKACISSNKTGIAEYIKSSDCGWIFDINKPEQLSEIMGQIIEDKRIVEEKGRRGRKVYESFFTMSCFEKRALSVLGLSVETDNSKKVIDDSSEKISVSSLGIS